MFAGNVELGSKVHVKSETNGAYNFPSGFYENNDEICDTAYQGGENDVGGWPAEEWDDYDDENNKVVNGKLDGIDDEYASYEDAYGMYGSITGESKIGDSVNTTVPQKRKYVYRYRICYMLLIQSI